MRRLLVGFVIVGLMALAGLRELAVAQTPPLFPPPSTAPATAPAAARIDSYEQEYLMGWSEIATTDAIPTGAIMELDQRNWDVPAKLAPGIIGVELASLPENGLVISGSVRDRRASFYIACRLPLDKPGVKPAARHYVEAIARELPAFVAQAQKEQAKRALAPQMEAVNLAKIQLMQANEQRQKLREHIRKATGRQFISVPEIRQSAAKMEDERQMLELENVGLDQRKLVIAQQLAELTERVRQATGMDDAIQELQNVVKLRASAAELAKGRFQAGQGSANELSAAQIALGEAQIRLATERRAVAQAAGADRITGLTAEGAQLATRQREISSRLEHIAKKLAGMGELDAALDRLEELERVAQNPDPEREVQELYRRFTAPPLWSTVGGK